jgi:hypothetical protein
MITKIVFIDEVPLIHRLYERYGIQILLDAEFAVEIWDCVPFLVPSLADYHVSDPLRFDGIRSFRTEREALDAIDREHRTTVFVLDIGYRRQSWGIFRALSRKRHVYGVQLLDTQPNVTDTTHAKMARWMPNLFSSPRRVVWAVLRKLPPRWLGIHLPDFVLSGGASSVDKIRYPFGVPTRQVMAHALDYDLFLKRPKWTQRDEHAPQENYAVFVDEFWPFHPDVRFYGMPFPVRAEEYYPKLVRFFERVEMDLGLAVIIAAHPKSYYERLPDYFGGRRVIKGKTAELVRDAKLVMTHDSAALNFVVLYRKPALFLNSAVHPAWNGYICIDRMASLFGKQPINLDKLPLTIDWDIELQVNEAAYVDYQEKYIKQSGSPNKPAWQIFADFLNTLH